MSEPPGYRTLADWQKPLRRPPALRPGDRIAVVATSSVVDSKKLSTGVDALAALGFDVRVERETLGRRGRLAGTDHERSRALLRAVRDPSVRAIVLARGGFGAARILPKLSDALADAAPKIVVGYSDATSLLTLLTGKLGWATFHGPMVASDFGSGKIRRADRASFLAALSGDAPQTLPLRATIRGGTAEARLLGGCLSILVTLIGTPYQVDLAGSILFLEDVNEEPYQLDRMLTHLRLAGALDGVRGIAFGEMASCGSRRELLGVLADRTRDLGVPVAFGLPSGHGLGRRTLPLGVRARLDATRRRLEILEAAVSP